MARTRVGAASAPLNRKQAEYGFGEYGCKRGEFFFVPHRALGRDLSQFRSAYNLCAQANSPRFAELTEFAAELSEFSPP